MPRKKTIPGSLYVQNGRTKLMIKFQGRRIATGLEDTKDGRKIAGQLLEQLYLASKGLAPKVEQEVEGVRLDDAFDKFLEVHCSNKSRTTQVNYTLAFKSIARSNYPLSVADIESDVLAYIQSAKQKGHSDVTVNTYLNQFQVFLNFCTERGWLPATDFKTQHKKKVEPQVQIFEADECEKLMAYFREHDEEVALLIEFMLLTGARVVDALTLTFEQVKPHAIIFVNKITKKAEVVPVPARAIAIVESLKSEGRHKVFRWTYAGKSYLNKVLNHALTATGIEKRRRSFQEFRITYRNNLLDAGVAPEVVMKLMRHHSLDVTTRHYTRITDEMMTNAVKNVGKGNIWATEKNQASL
jgi:integrase